MLFCSTPGFKRTLGAKPPLRKISGDATNSVAYGILFCHILIKPWSSLLDNMAHCMMSAFITVIISEAPEMEPVDLSDRFHLRNITFVKGLNGDIGSSVVILYVFL
jgi:hypothetical protein